MIMNFGLSRLADIAFGEDHYPVRRRGEKRRLNPNAEGIAWLDRQAAEVTATTETRVMSDTGTILPKNFEGAFILTRVCPRPRVDNHLRPMFQTFSIDGWSATGTYTDPCPDCYDFAYSDTRCDRAHGCGGHADVVSNYISELDRITAPTIRGVSATMTGADGAQVAVSWRVNPS